MAITSDHGDGAAMLASLDALMRALALVPFGSDRFEALGEPGRFDRVFGGQMLAQALLAAGVTVDGKEPHSLHAYFVQVGTPGEPLELSVERVRDGRSTSTRQVSVTQDGHALLVVIASFHSGPASPDLAPTPLSGPSPDQLPLLQDWVRELPPETRHSAHHTWVEQPAPLELRIGEPPSFLGGPAADGIRSHWMRLPGPVGEDRLLRMALLAYASDYLLLDMAFRAHPQHAPTTTYTGYSLDHSLWFHHPTRFDGWLLHTQEAVVVSGDRGLIRGAIHDAAGHLVASVMQEVLIRAPSADRPRQ